MRIEGEILYFGPGEFDWVGFFRPILSYEEMDNDHVYVITDAGEYKLCEYRDKRYIHVRTMKGKPLQEFGRELLDKLKEASDT